MKPTPIVPLALLLALSGVQTARASAPPPAPPAVSAPDTSAAAPPPQAQMFQLGLALQLPAAQSEVLLADVKTLQSTEPGADTARQTAQLARQAKALRRSERRCYQAASRLLGTLGAPPALRTWADGTVRLLSRPQIVSDEARPYVKSDPDTATILATIDEAEAVKVIGDRSAASLQTWLKLSQGGAGVWAQTLGRLAAGMQAAGASAHPFLLPREAVRRLRQTAPPGIPLPALRTLSVLVPRGKGNLSSLIRQTDVSVPAAQIAPAAQVLLEAYDAQPLIAALAPPGE